MPLVITKDWLTIGEVSELTGVPIHTLRFWESEFSQYFSPIRTNGRQRRYNEQAVEAVQMIKNLLKEEKYSIAGAKQVLARQIMVDDPMSLTSFKRLEQSVGQNNQPTQDAPPIPPTAN
ncbi:MAG: MerR family transcriptional regulator [Deltaproteobacteria bacterium]|nr:MerR family transcriptional regulator [Deltaproteobacteria bacterium]